MTKNKDDLLRMLDITPDDLESEDDTLIDFDFDAPSNDVEATTLTDTCFIQDEWDVRKGEDISRLHDKEDYNKLNPSIISDLHCMLFHFDPEIAGQCKYPRVQQFIETVMDSPEYKELRHSTVNNLGASELATVKLMRQVQELFKHDERGDKATERFGGKPTAPVMDGACLAAVGKGLAEASDEVEALDDFVSAMGGGGLGGDGPVDGQHADLDKIRSSFERMRSSKQLKEIFERAGAWKRAARAAQQSKTKHGYDDMVGVEMAGDVGRLLVHELAMLNDEDLEFDVLRRIVENQAACRQYEGVEQENKGPVVVVVDESGSMSGAPIANAKALALAMAWIAKHQKRWCALVGFAGGTTGTRLVLKPGKWSETALLDWLEHFYGGGTNLDVPLHQLPTTYWREMDAPKGKTDVIFVTDAQVSAPKAMIDSFNRWKQDEKVRCISIVLGSAAGDLEQVSNEIHCLPNLTVDCEAARSCLSI